MVRQGIVLVVLQHIPVGRESRVDTLAEKKMVPLFWSMHTWLLSTCHSPLVIAVPNVQWQHSEEADDLKLA